MRTKGAASRLLPKSKERTLFPYRSNSPQIGGSGGRPARARRGGWADDGAAAAGADAVEILARRLRGARGEVGRASVRGGAADRRRGGEGRRRRRIEEWEEAKSEEKGQDWFWVRTAERIQRETVRLQLPFDQTSTVHDRLVRYFDPQPLVVWAVCA